VNSEGDAEKSVSPFFVAEEPFMEYQTLVGTCNSAGDATATGQYIISGTVHKVVVACNATVATTADVTVKSYNTTLGYETLLVITNTNATGPLVYYPRACAVSANNTSSGTYEVPFYADGLLVMEVAQGGSGGVVTGNILVL